MSPSPLLPIQQPSQLTINRYKLDEDKDDKPIWELWVMLVGVSACVGLGLWNLAQFVLEMKNYRSAGAN
ncbi:Protein of unknown function [Pyronema omphalodes CBS 100304]|uniref:Uncharacterized protein n=1 Tax=Pyronema omphalodes (strain CBS 100304) TaxID=1076935 RepID=U4LBZ4_PYROM|nr:Protein of unknown function [Pyronema omphalodes CBS 100304]